MKGGKRGKGRGLGGVGGIIVWCARNAGVVQAVAGRLAGVV